MIVYHFLNEPNTNRMEDIEALLFELTKRQIKITRKHFLLVAMRTRWLAAMEESSEKIVGMGTLVPIAIPSGLCGRIEDVVLIPDYQGKGYGRKIMDRLIKEAKQMGMKHLALTSKPERVKANALYSKLGFVLRETNAYRLILSQ